MLFVYLGTAGHMVALLTWRTFVSGPYLVLEHLESCAVGYFALDIQAGNTWLNGAALREQVVYFLKLAFILCYSEGTFIGVVCSLSVCHIFSIQMSFQISSAEPQSDWFNLLLHKCLVC